MPITAQFVNVPRCFLVVDPIFADHTVTCDISVACFDVLNLFSRKFQRRSYGMVFRGRRVDLMGDGMGAIGTAGRRGEQ